MCGRYIIDESEDINEMKKILEKLRQNYNDTEEYKNLRKGEIFPGNTAPVIIPQKNNRIDAVPIRWGIDNPRQSGNIINARSEGLALRPMFKNAILHNRCIIPTNGFFEWKISEQSKRKEKYLIKEQNNPMLYLAGIFDFYKTREGERQARFVIITREAEGVISSIHSRMPVVIPKKEMLKWLNGSDRDVDSLINSPIPNFAFQNLG